MIRLLLSLLLLTSSSIWGIQKNTEDQSFLLITGCGRSGTSFTAKAMKLAGLDMPHETRLGKDGIISWLWTFDDTKAPCGPARKGKKFKHIFHQVRDPLKTISSVYYSFRKTSWQYIYRHIPQISANDPMLVKSAKYWYYWNLEAERIAEWTYQVEEIEKVFPEFCQRLGKKLDPHVFTLVPKNKNTRNNVLHYFTWAELKEGLEPELYKNIVGMARKYGYETPTRVIKKSKHPPKP